MLGKTEKEIIIVLIVLIAVVAAVGFFWGDIFDGSVDSDFNAEESLGSGSPVEASLEETQAGFPSDFPFEDGMEVTDNYKYDFVGSDNDQFTIEYQSARTVEENFNTFEEYLLSNDYSISNRILEDGFGFLYGKGSPGDFSISIEEKEMGIIINTSFLKR